MLHKKHTGEVDILVRVAHITIESDHTHHSAYNAFSYHLIYCFHSLINSDLSMNDKAEENIYSFIAQCYS